MNVCLYFLHFYPIWIEFGLSRWPRVLRRVGLWPLAFWDCGFESCRRHGCLSVVSVVCCQVEVSATGWSLVQRSPTECGVSECDRDVSIMKMALPTRSCCAMSLGGGGVYKIRYKRSPLNIIQSLWVSFERCSDSHSLLEVVSDILV